MNDRTNSVDEDSATTASDVGDRRRDSPSNSGVSDSQARLRVWPAVVLVVLLFGSRMLASVVDRTMAVAIIGFIGPVLCSAVILLWWLFFSRAGWQEKLLGLAGIISIAVVTTLLADRTMQGMGTVLLAVPYGIGLFAIVVIVMAGKLPPLRLGAALGATLLAFGYWDFVRLDGMWGDSRMSLSWRWDETAEDRFLASVASREHSASPLSLSTDAIEVSEWPGFRGPNRNGVQPGVSLNEDWKRAPPKEIWRTPIGPAWSSFAVAGRRLFTQEQRGENETIVCYDAESGEELWVQESQARFWEASGSVGPRATPTLDRGRLFALGATGLLHRLDPISGEVIWQRYICDDSGRTPPTWGFSSSPLVVDDVVIVHSGAADENGLLGYDAATGKVRWKARAEGLESYGSPQLATLSGLPCLLMFTNTGLFVLDPSDGSPRCKYDSEYMGYRVAQPWVISDSELLLGTPRATEMVRLKFDAKGDELSCEEVWHARGISPDFNDAVVHKGYLFGFDNNIFACADIETGQRLWKKGRYGNGQVLLLPDADQLLVLSETGELILLRATGEKLDVLSKFQVLEGKSWNHPVVVGNRLYVRNASEAACFELDLKQPDKDKEVGVESNQGTNEK